MCSILCFLYYIVIFPLSETKKVSAFRYEMLWAAEREMNNPACSVYMSDDFNKLSEPQYSKDGSTCYQIYNHRRYSDDKKPITAEIYQQRFDSGQRETWMMHIGIGLVVSTFLVAFVYGVGAVVSWVIKGFRRGDAQ